MGFIPASFKCDVCGAERLKANHWYWTIGDKYPSIVLRPFDALEIEECSDEKLTQESINIFCGEGCLSKWLSQNISNLHPKVEVSDEVAVNKLYPLPKEEEHIEPDPPSFSEYRKDLEDENQKAIEYHDRNSN